MPTGQTLEIMREIIHGLRQSESTNMNLANQLSHQEIRSAANLNQNIGSIPDLAQQANQAAAILKQIANNEDNMVRQLDRLEQMVTELQKQVH
jgi:DNA-binding MarR family transcriptional regulator